MGTRNLTIVIAKERVRVCQYGQWDGYPTGQGQTIADFLKSSDLSLFARQLSKLKPYSEKEVEKIWSEGGAINGMVSIGKAKAVEARNPELSRNQGANILNLIHREGVERVQLWDLEYKDDSSCEYWYELNLDTEKVTMNGTPYGFEEWKEDGLMEELQRQEE